MGRVWLRIDWCLIYGSELWSRDRAGEVAWLAVGPGLEWSHTPTAALGSGKAGSTSSLDGVFLLESSVGSRRGKQWHSD